MFFEFGIKDVIDILLVALMLYYLYRVMKESRSLNVFIGIMVFVLVWLFVSQVLEMRLLGSIMDKLVSVGVIGIIVLFQEEIRHFLYNLGARRQVQSVLRIFFSNKDEEKADKEAIMPIVMACMSMSRGKVGALIVIERGISLSDICDTGDYIDARINQRLIENIFFKNSPLHDGAMVITKKRIRAAGCILPVSHNQDIPKELGLRLRRHRHRRLRGDGTYQRGYQGRIPAAPLGRAARERAHQGDDARHLILDPLTDILADRSGIDRTKSVGRKKKKEVSQLGSQLEVVGGKEDSLAHGVGQAREQPERVDATVEVEEGRRLVEKNDGGLLSQGASNHHLLTLTVAQRVDLTVTKRPSPRLDKTLAHDQLVAGSKVAPKARIRTAPHADEVVDSESTHFGPLGENDGNNP